MTSYGPPYEQGGQPWGPPPNNGGYGPPPGGPGVASPRPAFPLWPIIVVTILFALFGLIPTIIASNKASQRRQETSRYWIAFVLSLLGSFVLYGILVVVLVFVVLAGTVAAVGAAANAIPSIGQQFTQSYPAPTGSATDGSGATTGPCAYTPDGTTGSAVALPDDPATTPTATRTWTLVTSAGTIVVSLDGAAAPCTVQSIVHLTELGYYDNTPCPRSVDSAIFLLQCGDPTGTTAGGPGYVFGDENFADADYSAGTVAMANSGPDTNGSQFFLIDKDARSSLAKNYTAFGTITTGLDILDKIVAAGNDGSNQAGGGKPTTPVTITTATIG